MIDVSLIADTQIEVKKICKKLYKKGIFDFSYKWKDEARKVMSLGYRGTQLWLEQNRGGSLLKCQNCGKDSIYITCPYYCIKCHEIIELKGNKIS